MCYIVIKHSGHLRTLEKCTKHSPAARVVYISLVFSNARRVLSQCNTRLRLLYLLNNLLAYISIRTISEGYLKRQIASHVVQLRNRIGGSEITSCDKLISDVKGEHLIFPWRSGVLGRECKL